MNHRQLLAQAEQLVRSGRMAVAEPLFRQVLATRPREVDALFGLGVICNATGRTAEAAELFRQVIALKPYFAEAHGNLGGALYAQTRYEEAVACFRQSLLLKPDHAITLNHLGVALAAAKAFDESVAAFKRAIALKPDYPEAFFNLGNCLRDAARTTEAEAAYRQAIQLKPSYAEAYGALAGLLNQLSRFDEAIAVLRQVLVVRPDYLFAVGTLAGMLRDLGRILEAMPLYRRYMEQKPDEPQTHSGMLFAMEYAGEEASVLTAEYVRWAERHTDPLTPGAPAFPNDRDPGRRLRIGYSSPDFCLHSVTFFIESLLAHHDPGQVETFCYADVGASDATTARLQQLAHHWRDTTRLDHPAFAQQVRDDQIDILVDLAGHTAGNRLLAFATRPAPVQVSYLGHINTTGMSAIQYRLVDAHTDPVGMTEPLHAETLVRLEPTFACYRPPADAPPVSPLPALQNNFVTFAALTFVPKVNVGILTSWAWILSRVSRSRLVLAGRGFQAASVQERVRGVFKEHGVDADRLEFIGTQPFADYLKLHERIDILLDPFPITGHTITCHALWMGVPTVSRVGDRYASRLGASVLSNMNLTELLAADEAAYIDKAVQLAEDLPRLAPLRGSLRERLAASPIMDAPAFACNVERAYRTMWRQWCEKG